jgi:hypothetical protein
MSYLVFPDLTTTFPGLTWGWPIKKTPRSSTIIQKTASGRGEVRIPLYAFPLWDYEINIAYIQGDNSLANWRVNTGYQVLTNFLIAVQGQGQAFLYLDPYDHTVPSSAPQGIGTGDGSTTAFDMVISFVNGGAGDLIQNFVSAPIIYDNGSVVSSANYTINQYGSLVFNTAPLAGHIISWSGQYYRLCRLSEDTWTDFTEDMFQIWSMKTFKFQTVLL